MIPAHEREHADRVTDALSSQPSAVQERWTRALDHLDELLAGLLDACDPAMALDPASLRIPRSHRNGPKPVVLPEGWLDDPEDATPPSEAAGVLVSGG